ncbi:MAG: hypothetical protein PVH79_03695 [Candidatus Bathyarchaeota archaeon]|jgi:hypothetical protein
MRKIWILAISVAIVGGVVLFEQWTALMFPMVEFEPSPLPELHIGRMFVYDYKIAGEPVGNYTFWIDSLGPYLEEGAGLSMAEAVYHAKSITLAERDGNSVALEAFFIFGFDLKPIEYRLNATLGEAEEYITCLFEEGRVLGLLETEGRIIEEPLELPEGAVLIDNLMVGHWGLLFKAFTPEPGKRVEIDVYIPQTLRLYDLEIIAEKKPWTMTLGGENIEARMVRVPELNLRFYLFEGEVIRMEETQQEIKLDLRPYG